MEENELRKKQEQAMREKQLAEEAKQHDPKVTVEWDGTHPVFTQQLNKALWRARQHSKEHK